VSAVMVYISCCNTQDSEQMKVRNGEERMV